MSIPMILAPGFSSAIIPHITSALAKHDYKMIRKNIRDCMDIILYIGIPISFCLFVYARPIYDIMFPPADPNDLMTCARVLQWFSIEAFLSTVCPILSSLLMAVGLRKLCIRFQVVMVSIKFILSYPLLSMFGYPGIVISSIVAIGVYIFLSMLVLAKRYQVQWKYSFHKLLIILLGCVGLFLIAWLCDLLGLKGYGAGRVMSAVQLGISGLLALGTYVGITSIFQLPQSLFHLKKGTLLAKVKKS